MPLTNTSHAIGALSRLLVNRVGAFSGHTATVGRPEPNGTGSDGSRLNLFLYEAIEDPEMRGVVLDEGQAAPMWMVVRYLVTPFDENGRSDTAGAHVLLGEALRALTCRRHSSR